MERRVRAHSVLGFDPAWLFLVAGAGLIGATVLVSEQARVDEVRHLRDSALAVEQHRHQRLDRYHEYLVALDRREPALVESLLASQLNQIPAARAAIPGTVHDHTADASVFPALEPPPLVMPVRTRVDSTLTRLTSNDATRIWLLAGGAVLVFVGLLPASRGWRREGIVHAANGA